MSPTQADEVIQACSVGDDEAAALFKVDVSRGSVWLANRLTPSGLSFE